MRGLIGKLHPRREGLRAPDQCGNLLNIKLTFEAQAKEPAVLPSDHRRTSERPAVQYDCRSARKTDRAGQLRTAGREVEDLHMMTRSVGLKERR